jgi:hypothetical protein
MRRLFNMYCRQIFWSLIQNDDIIRIFELILQQGPEEIDSAGKTDSQSLDSVRAFTVFIKVIGNECFITNNQKYITSFKAFLGKVVDASCQQDSKYKDLLRLLIEEAILESYHDHF